MINKIKIHNVRSISNFEVENASNINILCGANNTGKSTVLKCICGVIGYTFDLNSTSTQGEVEINIQHEKYKLPEGIISQELVYKATYLIGSGRISAHHLSNGSKISEVRLALNESENFLYTSFSKSRIGNVGHGVNKSSSAETFSNPDNLTSKIDRILSDREYPNHELFRNLVYQILGFNISCVLVDGGGKLPGITLDEKNYISIENMGDGVYQILSLIVNLINANDKIFILEEIENDLHPSSLKVLCNLIKSRSTNNQFFISTHSNIVIRELSQSEKTKMFKFTAVKNGRIPLTSIKEVVGLDEKISLLEEMGYDCYDIGLYKYWFIFEESSSERLFRDYIFKWFFPEQKKYLRTISSCGIDKAEIQFDAINAIFTVFHLGNVFKNKVFIALDSGRKEKEIIDRIKATYQIKGWNIENFINFSFHDLEECYPISLKNDFLKIKELPKKQKRDGKKELFDSLLTWINNNEDDARNHFQLTLNNEIEILKNILK